jgi:hypothetical protein
MLTNLFNHFNLKDRDRVRLFLGANCALASPLSKPPNPAWPYTHQPFNAAGARVFLPGGQMT